MKKTFTKTIYIFAAFFLLVSMAVPAFGQFTENTLVSNAHGTAIATDASGNTYVIEDPSDGNSGGEIVRYSAGTGTGQVIYSGSYLSTNDINTGAGNDDYAFGIAVDSHMNVYFSTNNPTTNNPTGTSDGVDGTVIKLTNSNGNYTASVLLTSNANIGYYAGLAIDGSDNLYVEQYDVNGDGGIGTYEVAKYNTSGVQQSVLYDKLEANYNPNGNTYSAITGLACDATGNVYVADWFVINNSSYGGFVEKLTKNGSSYTATRLSSNTYCTALACDASGNLYATSMVYGSGHNSTAYSVVEYTGGAGSPQTLYSGLGLDGTFYPFGIIAKSSNNLLVLNGTSTTGTEGDYDQLVGPPSVPASSVGFSNIATNGFTASWSNGNGTSRAVFIDQTSSTTAFPTLVNGTTYSPNPNYGSGSTAGSGWYCVANGSSSVAITGLTQGTAYRVAVVEYNGSTGYQNYLTNTSGTTYSGASNNPNNVTTPTPTLGVSGGTVTVPSTVMGTASASVNFTLTGSNLNGGNVTVTAPSGFQVSSDNTNFAASFNIAESGTLSAPVYVRLSASDAVNSYSGYVSISGGGASPANQAVTGQVNASSDASLSNLTLNNGTLSPSFSSGTFNYTTTESNSTSSVTVMPTTSNAGATVQVNGASASTPVNLSVGTNSIAVKVTAQNGTTVDTYNITATRAGITESGSLAALSTTYGTPSSYTTFTVTGYGLSGGILVTAPNGYHVSLDNTNYSSTVTANANGSPVTVYIRLAAATAAGSYAGNVTLSNAGTASVLVAQPASTVNPAPLTITADNQTKVYGAAVPTLTASYNGFVNGDSNSSLSTQPTLNTSATAGSPVNGSPYAINASGAADGNYTISYVAGSLTVTQASLLITADNQMSTYGGAIPALTVSYNAFVNGDTPASLTTQPTVSTTGTSSSPAGTYSITPSGASDPNYAISYAGGTLTIGQAPLNITADNKTIVQGQAIPALTATYATFVNGDTQSSLTTQPTISTTATSSSAPGNYPITVSGAADPNYSISYTAGTLTISPSSDATLSNFHFSVGTHAPAFVPGQTTYADTLNTSISSIKITPYTSSSSATVTINGAAVASGSPSQPIALYEGQQSIATIVVTAGDGTTQTTYTVNLFRVASSNPHLSFLSISNHVPLSPAFAVNTTSYTASVPNATASVSIKPLVADSNATVTVNGMAVASGTSSQNIPLTIGNNTINTVVTAQDGTTTLTYTVAITRAPSSVATLSSLALSRGAVTPGFSRARTSYTLLVGGTVTSITETPTTADTTATVTVNGTPVTSGTATAPIALNIGSNTITTVVTAQDGSTTDTYTVTVTRQASSNAKLAYLGLSHLALSPSFDKGTYSYTANAPNSLTSTNVEPIEVDTTARITVNGAAVASGTSIPVALSVGDNTITTVVTAQDGTTQLTYTVTVTRAGQSALAVNLLNRTDSLNSVNDGVLVHQGVSPNGDGINDVLTIDGINNYPNNRVTIIDRNGTLVYEARGYDNAAKVFDGHSNKNGAMQLPGTYFYSLDYVADGQNKHKTGYIILKY